MIRKIDINSDEFQTELELTKQFTNKVLEEHNLVYNPDDEVNESIQMGLTRNKLIYGKRFCPCFMVIGNTPAEQENSENRLCPCKPALTNEIPSKGLCHCGIFCTEQKANEIKTELIEIQNLMNNRPDDDSIERKHLRIEDIKASLGKYLDISMGNLFSTLSIGLNTFNKDAKTMKFDPNTDNLDEKRDISINPLFNTFKDLNKSLINVDGNQEFNELEYNRRYLVYSILLFLSVISIIILLLHKFVPNLISNITLMAYFIGIILIISFIHFILKQ